MTDTLPAGVIDVKDASMEYTRDGNVLTFVIGDMEAGEAVTITYTVVYSTTGNKLNEAEVTARHFEIDDEDERLYDKDDETVNVKEPGLNILKTNTNNNNTVILSGGAATLNYTLKVINNGTVSFDSVTVKDEFTSKPEGAETEYKFDATERVSFDEETATFTIIGGLAAGAEIEINYSVVVNKDGKYENDATVTGYYGDNFRTDKDSAGATVTLPYIPPYIPDDPIDPTPPPVIPDDPAPPVEEEIIDEAPPLAPFIPVEPEDEARREDELVLEEEIVPLGEMPQTGIEDMTSLWILALCVSMLMAGALGVMVTKKGRTRE